MQEEQDQRELLLRIVPMSASLAGLAVTAVTIFQLKNQAERLASFGDDALVVCAALFLLASYLGFWALRTRNPRRANFLADVVDFTFLIALTGLVIVGFLMVYSLI
jgi:hypothetical protein